MGNLGRRRCGEPGVHGAALVGFDVAKGYPAQALQRNEARCGGRDQGKHCPGTAVKQQRLRRLDQELVEGKAGGRSDLADICREPEDTVRDLVDCCLHIILRRAERRTLAHLAFAGSRRNSNAYGPA